MSWIQSVNYAQQAALTQSWDLCQQWLGRALDQSPLEDSEQRSLVLNNLGVHYRRFHRLDRARECFEKAFYWSETPWLRGRILANWAVLEHRGGDLKSARKRYQEALLLCSEYAEDPLAVARICVNLAWLHLQQDRAVQTESLLKRAKGLISDFPEEIQLESRIWLGFGRLDLTQKRLAKAEAAVLSALRAAQRMNSFDPLLHAQARAGLAQVFSHQAEGLLDGRDTHGAGLEKAAQAEGLFGEAEDLLEDSGLPVNFERLDLLGLHIDHYIRVKAWSKAEVPLQRLLGLVEKMPFLDPTLRSRVWEKAAEVLRRLEQRELAAAASQKALALARAKRSPC